METDDSYALNTFIVHNDDGKPIIDARDLKSIEDRIYTEISRPFAPASQVNQRIPRTLKQFSVKTFVDFEQDDNSQRTTLKLVTIDQPGILSLVGQVFIEHNIRLHTAQVATFGERVEDYFYISTPDKQQITDENKLEDLRQSIIKTLNSET
jgi:[protein-PII] uridylyltransferase